MFYINIRSKYIWYCYTTLLSGFFVLASGGWCLNSLLLFSFPLIHRTFLRKECKSKLKKLKIVANSKNVKYVFCNPARTIIRDERSEELKELLLAKNVKELLSERHTFWFIELNIQFQIIQNSMLGLSFLCRRFNH